MIVRAWRGYASAGGAEAYPKHLLASVRPKLERLAGFRGLSLLRRHIGDGNRIPGAHPLGIDAGHLCLCRR